MATEQSEKRVIEERTEGEVAEKKIHKRRRRNYDEYDEEVTKNDSKTPKDGSEGEDEDEESEVDDEKLDMLATKEDEEEDDLTEIDTANIIAGGRRTRGKVIDYKKTAQELDKESNGNGSVEDKARSENGAEEPEDEEEDDDADFDVAALEKK